MELAPLLDDILEGNARKLFGLAEAGGYLPLAWREPPDVQGAPPV